MILITGVSKGIGKALALLFLERGENVVGIGRSHQITHPNFSFIELDLAHSEQVALFDFPIFEDKELILFNNAGILGNAKLLNNSLDDDLQRVLQVNTIAPILLTRKLLQQYGDAHEISIINISSGAAEKAIPGWMNYSLSKAALDAFSKTLQAEEAHLGRTTKIYCVAPGVVDTDMQGEIRNLDACNFPSVHHFRALKKSKELDLPNVTALKLLQLIKSTYLRVDKISLRDIQLDETL